MRFELERELVLLIREGYLERSIEMWSSSLVWIQGRDGIHAPCFRVGGLCTCICSSAGSVNHK